MTVWLTDEAGKPSSSSITLDDFMSDLNSPDPVVAEEATDEITKTILVVDDDVSFTEAIKLVLEDQGYEIIVAHDGEAGLSMVTPDVDLMILDFMLPRRSGFMVLEKLHSKRTHYMPIIMITANEASRHEYYAEKLGVSDYLRKPFSMNQLIDSVNKFLRPNRDEESS